MNNPSFNIDQGEAAIGADDGQALERLAQYFLRAPISLQKMSWNAQTKTVLRPMSDELPMPAKELLQSHFAVASSKSKLSLTYQQTSHIHPAFILQNF